MDDKKKLTDDELEKVAGGMDLEIPKLDPDKQKKWKKSIDIVQPEGELPYIITHGGYSDEEIKRLTEELLKNK